MQSERTVQGDAIHMQCVSCPTLRQLALLLKDKYILLLWVFPFQYGLVVTFLHTFVIVLLCAEA